MSHCFGFISDILSEYIKLRTKFNGIEFEASGNLKRKPFTITTEQRESIVISETPLSLQTFVKNINAVIDGRVVELLVPSVVNQWLVGQGVLIASKQPSTINRIVYKPTPLASKVGIVERKQIIEKSGESKEVIQLDEFAQRFIIENLEQIIDSSKS